MNRIYRVIRAIILSVIGLAIAIPALVYVALSTPCVQERLRVVAEEQLSAALGTEVTLDKLSISPFNRVNLSGLKIADDFDRTALDAPDVEARFEFWHFVSTGRLDFDYALLRGTDITLYKESPDGPLNIANIIKKLKGDETKKEPTKFDVTLHTVVLEDCSAKYDVYDTPTTTGKFNPNHISVSKFNLTANAPKISNDLIAATLKHLSFEEKTGFTLSDLTASVRYTPDSISVDDLTMTLPGSQLLLGSYHESIAGLRDKQAMHHVSIAKGSYLSLNDIAAFVPALRNEHRRFNMDADATFNASHVSLTALNIDEVTDGGTFIHASGEVDGLSQGKDNIAFSNIKADGAIFSTSLTDLLRHLPKPVAENVLAKIRPLGKISFETALNGDLKSIRCFANISTAIGKIDADIANLSISHKTATGSINAENINLSALPGIPQISNLSAAIDFDVAFDSKAPSGTLSVNEAGATILGHSYHDIALMADMDRDGVFDLHLDGNAETATLFADIHGSTAADNIAGSISISHFNPNGLGLIKQYPGYVLDTDITFDLSGKEAEWIDGWVNIDGLKFRPQAGFDGAPLEVKHFNITADNTVRPNTIAVESDFLNGSVQGQFSLANIIPQARDIMGHIMPALTGGDVHEKVEHQSHNRFNDFRYEFTISNAEGPIEFLKLPIAIIHPVTVEGSMDYSEHSLLVMVDAPYLQKGDMIIENTALQIKADGNENKGSIFVTTQFPTKKGEMVLVGGMTAENNSVDTELDWQIERAKPVEGKLTFSTLLGTDPDNNALTAQVNFTPCDIRFGDDTWSFSPSTITYKPGLLDIQHFALSAKDQQITIDGRSDAANPDDEITIGLKNIVLENIFETLDINKALLAGTATGSFHARGLFGGDLSLECPHLMVKNIGYNRCIFGDGDIEAHWDNDTKAFCLDANITEPGGKESHIYGSITPATESLDMNFDANHVKVGFMKPFIDAFSSDIKGYASGHAHLFGSFKYIDLEGDIYAEDLGIKVDFTNAWYFASDSIHLRPGLISIKDVTIKDAQGNTALLNGRLDHTFFKDPVFDFRITNAKNFLSYDTNPKISPDWYGKIYGNGAAFISGKPGVVNIDVNMATAPGSTFTFVLSDMLEAEQYNFITFRDKNRDVITDTIIQADVLPAAVREYRDRILAQAAAENPPSAYNMNIQVDVTPDAKVILVMDPIGGDEIKAYGNGNLRMTYASEGNDLRMYGTYTIDRGSYNFTLQDIIVKDFNIREGSSITFTGDPYNARLDIKATYTVNANLSDLDESFLQDKELNRTNVPVHALLLVTGDMRQPDIDFDLEFPTLSSDIYRKVRSIISTDEMMNRQIIYLLALNRFYTPDYMSATRGNELFSVASSTISSRLSSMLGKLSESWSIAPNIRSERGDFSDVEFDLALSSSLLNNRLRLNGNFGYRDKSLNTTQFIGDFDLEYLLNRKGSWRLKAYNRYNDQNYYLRSAQTTQGVGIMFRRDFDNMFSFLHRKKKKTEQVSDSTARASAPIVNNTDTITAP